MAVNDSVMNVATRINTERMQTQPVEIPIKVKYKNYQGITSIRNIIPQNIYYGSTDYHKEDQWLLEVWDIEKDALRTYAVMDIIEFIRD